MIIHDNSNNYNIHKFIKSRKGYTINSENSYITMLAKMTS